MKNIILASCLLSLAATRALAVQRETSEYKFYVTRDTNHIILERMINKWLFIYTNLYRKQNGLDTVAKSSCLDEAAKGHALYLCNTSLQAKQLVLGHSEDPNSVWFQGYSPTDRAAKAGCDLSCGENALYTGLQIFIANDFKDIKQLDQTARDIARSMVFDMWHHSKGHRANMLNKQHKFLGTSVLTINHNFNDCNNGNKEEFIYLVAFAIQLFAN